MTKQEAITAMQSGKKVTHRHFTSDEWATMEDGKIVLEDGVKCNPDEFWKWRTNHAWHDGWELFEEPQPVTSRADIQKHFEDDGAYAD